MKNLVGNLLIAPPSVKGNFWQKTTILVTEHHSLGSVGLVLNKPSKMSLKEFGKQNSVELNIPGVVHIGGPANVKALTMLHTNEWQCSNTMKINQHFSISSSHDILTNMAMGHCPQKWRMFVGLCSWTKNQLQQELEGVHPYNKNHSWITATADTDIVFGQNSQTQWTESIELAGSEFAQNLLA
jgi:putative transcriptional regulator